MNQRSHRDSLGVLSIKASFYLQFSQKLLQRLNAAMSHLHLQWFLISVFSSLSVIICEIDLSEKNYLQKLILNKIDEAISYDYPKDNSEYFKDVNNDEITGKCSSFPIIMKFLVWIFSINKFISDIVLFIRNSLIEVCQFF